MVATTTFAVDPIRLEGDDIELLSLFYDGSMDADASRQLAIELVQQLQSRGFTAYWAGGCVRDLLLERPAKDYDVATSATPGELCTLFPDAQQVGAHFGVVLLHRGQAQVEIATFRSDHNYEDGRHPGEVRFETDPREDVKRRDFTINALLMDPLTGEIFDYVGGREDLRKGIIRAIGDPETRFREDHLRMLRAVRFAARFSFVIEPGTMKAIQRLHGAIHRISAERVRDELSRILVEGGAEPGFRMLDESGLLAEILPEVAAMKGVEQPPEFHPEGDVWVHTLLLLHLFDQMPERTLTLGLGSLLHDVGKPPTFERADRIRFNDHAAVGARMTGDILRRLKYSNEVIDQTVALVAQHMRFGDAQKMKDSTLKRFLRLEQFAEHLELHRLDCSACHGQLTNYDFIKEKLATLPQEQLRPPKLISGGDLIRLGYQPGPAFSGILQSVEDAQLEGELHTGHDAIDWVRARYRVPDGAPLPDAELVRPS